MHLKLKDFESLIDCNCQNSWDKNLICTELCPHNKSGAGAGGVGRSRDVRDPAHFVPLLSSPQTGAFTL